MTNTSNMLLAQYWRLETSSRPFYDFMIKKRTVNLAPVLQFFKIFLKIIAFAYIYQLAKFSDLMSCVSKDIFKNGPSLIY